MFESACGCYDIVAGFLTEMTRSDAVVLHDLERKEREGLIFSKVFFLPRYPGTITKKYDPLNSFCQQKLQSPGTDIKSLALARLLRCFRLLF